MSFWPFGSKKAKSRLSATIVGTNTMYETKQDSNSDEKELQRQVDEKDGKPYSVYIVEVRLTHSKWRIQRRVQEFLDLRVKLLDDFAHPPDINPTVPTPKSRKDKYQRADEPPFVRQIRASLDKWLTDLITDPDIRQSTQLAGFLELPKTLPPANDDDGQPGSSMSQSQSSGISLSDDPEQSSDTDDASRTVGLQDFEMLKVVGKGSFGKVVLVRRIDSGKMFAMKILKKEHVIKRNQVAHTQTERNVLEQIKHPFVVRLYYAFQSKTKLYLVLDYCPGGELFFHLGRAAAGKFSERLARFYAAEITLALEYLHDRGIVYRDLKPENVLLDEDGHVAITDFGLSKEGIQDNHSAHSFCGTPEYLAPEILQRTGHGRAADWWSLGALLFEMLTGMPPFYSRDRDRLFKKILTSELRFPIYFSAEVKSLLRGLMNRDPQQRLGSISDAKEIKAHPFFRDIDWDDLAHKSIEPPFKPYIQGTNNFAGTFTEMPLLTPGQEGQSVLQEIDEVAPDSKFAGFTYVGDASSE